ncbi:Uncharacterised protein [Chlamydia abortus]|nr:Uncharacterised protein [Chlamydia abortus]
MNVSPVSVKFTAAVLKLLFKLSPKKITNIKIFLYADEVCKVCFTFRGGLCFGTKVLEKNSLCPKAGMV